MTHEKIINIVSSNVTFKYSESEKYFKFGVYEDNIMLMNGHIKYDGCSIIDFSDNDKVHICGINEWAKYIIIMRKLVELANKNFTITYPNDWWQSEYIEMYF